MDAISLNLTELIIWLGALIVVLSAMGRFNNPQIMLVESTNKSWIDHLRDSLRMRPITQNQLLIPTRANTTIFRYRLYQLMYALIAMLTYFVMLIPEILNQVQQIIMWFAPEGMPRIVEAGPLVLAAFVILILPNVPPFRWADIKVRSLLYERAMIPAQQLRELHRLKMAEYEPSDEIRSKVQELAAADGFDKNDIVYNSSCPTTQSLWSKCSILIEQIKQWETDDLYKTAFAVLRESDSELRSVDAVKNGYYNLTPDARVCFSELRLIAGEKNVELENREAEFRKNCRTLLHKIYSLLAGVSLHSHYSDRDRVQKFGKLGFKLYTQAAGPLPNSNDMLILSLIMCTILVMPLAYKLGVIKAVMIGLIMLSAVLTPIILAHVCPNISGRNQRNKADIEPKQYIPNVIYPLLSASLAALLGFIIFFTGGQFIEASGYCNFTGVERYTNCSYPWSFIHAGIAFFLALRFSTGEYPDIKRLKGSHKYRQWGSFMDAIICSLGLILIAVLFVIPQLQALRGTVIEPVSYFNIVLRVGLVAFVLGFIVPTWYRAQKSLLGIDRRENQNKRDEFIKQLHTIRNGVQHN